MQWDQDKVFDNAAIYDLAFSWDLTEEIDFFKTVLGNSRRNLLIPACGTGRYAYRMGLENFHVTAFDLHAKMLAFALSYRRHPNIHYLLEDMTDMNAIQKNFYEGGLLLNNSFRYILEREKAVQHLQNVSGVLENGGLYLIEMGLNEARQHKNATTSWVTQRDDAEVTSRWTLEEWNPPYALDRVEIRLKTPTEEIKITEKQPQLTWTFCNILDAIRQTRMTLKMIYDAKRNPINNWTTIQNECGKYYLLLENKNAL